MSLAPVHIFTNFVYVACTGTHFYQLCLCRLHRYTFLPTLSMSIAPVFWISSRCGARLFIWL